MLYVPHEGTQRGRVMTEDRFREITSRYTSLRAALVGDVALDRYMEIDPAIEETSIETGLPVWNVVRIRPQPGAGGNVLANLAALGPSHLSAVGYCGDDGEGLELRRALEALGTDLAHFHVRSDRTTFAYLKPLLLHAGSPPEERNRLDLRSRAATPRDLEDAIIAGLTEVLGHADAIVAMDQVPEPGAGVLTPRVKEALTDLAEAYPDKTIVADSRTAAGDFSGVFVKVNLGELAAHFSASDEDLDPEALAARWSGELGRPVFVTLGQKGLLVADGDCVTHVRGVPADPPIDEVGAGDAVLANVAMALAAGASAAEAAELGNLAGGVVVKQIGTTGTATVEAMAEMREAVQREQQDGD
jgi:rfaE bifunctional protein kinase chain/domain